MKPKRKIPYEQITSQKDQSFFYPDELVQDSIKNPYKLKNKYRRYLIKGILNDFESSNFDRYYKTLPEHPVELFINDALSDEFDGRLIPKSGYVLNIGIKINESGYNIHHKSKIPTQLTAIVNAFDFTFPDDKKKDSSLRQIIGMDKNHTIFNVIPFRLLTPKLENGSKLIRDNHWVYRIRFIIQNENKENFKQFSNGYIGATSRNKGCYRFFQHYESYKSNNETHREIYKAWTELRDHNVDHIIIFELLERCSTREEAFNLEQKLIQSEQTLMPNGLNMTLGGEQGLEQCKACGIESFDLENKDKKFADYIKSNKKKHITPVRSHLMKTRSGITTRRGHWRCFTEQGKSILINILGLDENEFNFED